MSAAANSIGSALRISCIAIIPLFAACGGASDAATTGGAGSVGSLAATCSGTMAVAPPPAPAAAAPAPGMELTVEQVGTFSAPVLVTAPPADFRYFFVVERGGVIRRVDKVDGTATTFLDISPLVASGDGNGLVGLTFGGSYDSDRRFYVSYIDAGTNALVIARYLADFDTRQVAEPDADRIILTIPNPGANPVGGTLSRGDFGTLYISLGDGGDGAPGDDAQDLGSLFGKILRIEVSGGGPGEPAYTIPPDNPCLGQPGARPEIWNMGLRNASHFSMDQQTGDLYIADIGQGYSEVNISPYADGAGAGRGRNFGWRIMEGKQCLDPAQCDTTRLTQPVLDYPHTGGACSIVSGVVYRAGGPIPRGTYFYADQCLGVVRSFRYNGQVQEHTEWPFSVPGVITSFGQDAAGEVYIATREGGVFRIVAVP